MTLSNPRRLLVFAYVALFLALLPRSLSIEFNGDLIALLPDDNPHLETYAALGDLQYSEGGFDAILVAPNSEDIIGLASEVSDRIARLTNTDGTAFFAGVELENDLYELRSALVYLMPPADLDTLYVRIDDLIIREKERVNPFFIDFEEDFEENDEDFSEKEDGVTELTSRSVLLEELLRSRRYEIDSDSTQILLRVVPAFARGDFDRVSLAWTALQKESLAIISEYAVDNVDIHWGGSYLRHFNKINDIQKAVVTALIIGIGSLIAFLFGYIFLINRHLKMPRFLFLRDLLVMFFVLFSGFSIVLGLASFLFHEINVFTGIIFSILFGINLDYILHVYAIERKWSGQRNVAFRDYFTGARPIIYSAITTGIAIFSLIFSEIDGFQQFGIIFFASISINLAATFLFLGWLRPKNLTGVGGQVTTASSDTSKPFDTSEASEARFQSVYNLANWWIELPRYVRTWSLGGLSLVLLILAIIALPTIRFTYDFASLEPAGTATSFNEKASNFEAGPSTFEPSYFLANSIDEARGIFNAISDNPELWPDIDRVESLAARFPHTDDEMNEREHRVQLLRDLIEGESELLSGQSEETRNLTDLIIESEPPSADNLPNYIQNRFFLRDGSMAPMVIVYPAMSLSDGEVSIQFRKSSGTVATESGTFYAASTSIIASSILEMLINEARFLILVPLFTILLVLLLTQRSVVQTSIVLLPVLLGLVFLTASNLLLNIPLNLYNVIVFPILIGVGTDNGIHLADVWRLENQGDSFLTHFLSGRFPVLVACSLTTVMGFTGLLFIDHPGITSIGVLATAGVLTNLLATFFTALLLHTFNEKSK